MILTSYDLDQLKKDKRGRRKETKTSPYFKNLDDDQTAWRKSVALFRANTLSRPKL